MLALILAVLLPIIVVGALFLYWAIAEYQHIAESRAKRDDRIADALRHALHEDREW